MGQSPIRLRSLDDPEVTTSHISKKIKLDLNDSWLLVDHIDAFQHVTRPVLEGNRGKSFGTRIRRKNLGRRYNVSNDEAYDLLKENHQHKIRGMLGNLHVEHSLPALRLQWPFVSMSFPGLIFIANII